MSRYTATVLPFPQQDVLAPCGVSINTPAIRHNYRLLKEKVAPGKVAGIVKANAYGVGAVFVAKVLYSEGCRDFFVAYIDEAIELRESDLPQDTAIYVLNGYFPKTESLFAHYNLTPVLTDEDKVKSWTQFSKDHALPCAIHIDTGMNRTGIPYEKMKDDTDLLHQIQSLKPQLVMSHLACGGDLQSAFNEIQRQTFENSLALLNLPYKPIRSFANSGGTQLGKGYYFDMVRPGLSLYTSPTEEAQGFREAIRFWARIYQIQKVKKGQTIGYNQTFTMEKDRIIATLSAGYADGFTWNINKETKGAFVMIGDHRLPILGRISMDLITVDASDVPPDLLFEGQKVDLLNKKITVHTHAAWANLRPYEILLKFGKRVKREYIL